MVSLDISETTHLICVPETHISVYLNSTKKNMSAYSNVALLTMKLEKTIMVIESPTEAVQMDFYKTTTNPRTYPQSNSNLCGMGQMFRMNKILTWYANPLAGIFCLFVHWRSDARDSSANDVPTAGHVTPNENQIDWPRKHWSLVEATSNPDLIRERSTWGEPKRVVTNGRLPWKIQDPRSLIKALKDRCGFLGSVEKHPK